MHHQVFEDFLQSVQDLDRHLVLDGLLVRRPALSEQTICTGREQRVRTALKLCRFTLKHNLKSRQDVSDCTAATVKSLQSRLQLKILLRNTKSHIFTHVQTSVSEISASNSTKIQQQVSNCTRSLKINMTGYNMIHK